MPHHDSTRDFGYAHGRKYTYNYGQNAVGVFRDRSSAECAIDRLLAAGYSRDHISMVMRETDDANKWAEGYGVKTNKAGEGAAVGAGTGGVLGGIAGFLAGLGLLAIPGIGPLLAIGPIAGALAGIVAGGTAGGLLGALVGLGIPEEEARYYEEDVKQGSILVAVECQGNCDSAYAMFRDCGASNFDTTTSTTTSGFGTSMGERTTWGGTMHTGQSSGRVTDADRDFDNKDVSTDYPNKNVSHRKRRTLPRRPLLRPSFQ
jgi:hypothetical protein